MSDREPKIGDVIRYLTARGSHDFVIKRTVTAAGLQVARELVASGRWVIVDPQPAAEPGPNTEGSNE